MKDQFRNEYSRRAKLILNSKLNGRNKIMALKTWTVSILRNGAEQLSRIRMNYEKWTERPGNL